MSVRITYLINIRNKLLDKVEDYAFSTNSNDYSGTIKNLLISIKILEEMIGDNE